MSERREGIDLSFREDDLRRIAHFHGATIKEFEKARQRALKKLFRWLKTRIKRKFAASAGLPQKVAGQRMKEHYNQKEGVIAIWLGLNPVEAHRTGRVSGGASRRSAGASVRSVGGRRFFRGSFQSDVYSGDGVRRVWIRKASKHFDPDLYPYQLQKKRPIDPTLAGRFPLVMARVEIADAIKRAVQQDKKAIQAHMVKLFEHELKVAIGIIETRKGRV